MSPRSSPRPAPRRGSQLALYLWLAAITGARRGELCAVQVCDLDLEHALLHVAFNYVVKGGQKVRKDTKTHQDRWVALDPVERRVHRRAPGRGRVGAGDGRPGTGAGRVPFL